MTIMNEDVQQTPFCQHSNLELEMTSEGYFTGNYLCLSCGQLLKEDGEPPVGMS